MPAAISSLLLNAALLLALAQVIDLAVSKGHTAWVNRSSIVTGLLIGLICVLLMKISATLLLGITFDTRSVLLALTLALGLLVIERLRRRRDLDALRASEERTRRIVENAPDLIFINRDDRIHYINPAGIRLLGMRTAEEIVGRSIYDLSHPDSHAAVRARIAILRSAPGVSVPVLKEEMLGVDDSSTRCWTSRRSSRES